MTYQRIRSISVGTPVNMIGNMKRSHQIRLTKMVWAGFFSFSNKKSNFVTLESERDC